MSTIVHGVTPRTGIAFRERDVRVPFPGIPTTSDGAGMVTWVETHITQGACAYPITSSTTMGGGYRSEEHTSELQSLTNLVCRLLLEKKKNTTGRRLFSRPHPIRTR